MSHSQNFFSLSLTNQQKPFFVWSNVFECTTELGSTVRVGNEGEKAASFYHQLAAFFPYMFSNFYSVKNHKIANNSTTTKAIEKISTDFESLELWIFFDVFLTKFKNN